MKFRQKLLIMGLALCAIVSIIEIFLQDARNEVWEKFKEKAKNPQVACFEIKLAQGAKIRGGHVEGSKVNEEIASIRGVEPWKTVDSPNRHKQFNDLPSLFDFIERLRDEGGKPVGIKIVMGLVPSFKSTL